MKYDNLLRYAVRVVDAYSGEKPLHIWLKDFFRANPQMGSRDRKLVSEMVYCFYRMGHALKGISAEECIQAGLFLCNEEPVEALGYLKPEWNEAAGKTIEEKIAILKERYPDFSPEQIFPFGNLLSEGVDYAAYCLSYLKKPELFIRVRKGKEEITGAKLREHKIAFSEPEPDSRLLFKAYSFANGTRLDEVLDLNREAVVQDLSSQKTGSLMKLPEADPERAIRAWDCCAASGGKSILLADLYPMLDLTVSDIRKTILENLRKRFAGAGIKRYRAFQIDLTRQADIPGESFDLILADLPCTGSGTWSRTPESLYFFDPGTLDDYSRRQKIILSNITGNLKAGGMLVYITCSVFAAENEEVVRELEANGELQMVSRQMIAGYADRADSMFAAVFGKISYDSPY
jgi:16S rRNA (cytosine967-C5)-methyltransferase